jgi:hypothetical protein
MADILDRYPYLFPLFFAGMWLAVTSVIAVMSGWFELQSRYPDRSEEPIRRWAMASGRLGPLAQYSSCMVLAVCPSGLRVGVWRVFGPFCRNFFVPWSDLGVQRTGLATRLVIGAGALGDRPAGALTVSNGQAAQLAEAAGKLWPPSDTATEEPRVLDVAGKLALQWVLISAAAAIFFSFGPQLFEPHAPRMPVGETVVFPTVFFGAAALLQFVLYLGGRRSSGAK